MNVDAMLDLLDRGIPTATEFIGFAEANGWGFQVKGDKAALKASSSDPLAVAFAKVLSREPYRTNVLAELARMFAPAASPDLDDGKPDRIAEPEPVPAVAEPGPPPEDQELPGAVLATGETCPAGPTRVMVSEWGTHALRDRTLDPGTPVRWELVRVKKSPSWPSPSDSVVVCRLRLPDGLATLFRSAFREAFPAADPG